jgi:hypothetical protein
MRSAASMSIAGGRRTPLPDMRSRLTRSSLFALMLFPTSSDAYLSAAWCPAL